MGNFIIKFQQFNKLNEVHAGAPKIEDTVTRFIEEAESIGITKRSLDSAIAIIIDYQNGKLEKSDLPKFRKGSDEYRAVELMERCIHTLLDDGYPDEWVYGTLEAISSNMNEMAIVPRSEKPHRKIEIDLSGPEGNAFYLIGLAKKLYAQKYPERVRGGNLSRGMARKSGEDLPTAADLFAEELMSSDYEHLLQVFDREFGDWVILYR